MGRPLTGAVAPGQARIAADWAALVGIGLLLTRASSLPVAAALLAVGLFLCLVVPSAALAAALTALPFVFRPVAIGTREFSHLEIALLGCWAALGGRVAWEVIRARSLRPAIDLLRPIPLTAGASALVLAALISTRFAFDPDQLPATHRALRTVIVEPLILIPAVRWCVRRGEWWLAGVGLAAGAGTASVWGLAQVLQGAGAIQADSVRRARGPYLHPNNLSFFLERAWLLLLVPLALSPRTRRAALVAGLFALAALLATFSRGALLAVPAAVAVALWASGRLRAIAGVAAGAVAVVGALLVLAGDRILATGSGGAEPSRAPIWRASARMIRDFPWTGIGLDQFYVMYGLRYIEPAGWPERYTSHPHDILLDAWLSLGAAGVVLLLLLVAWLVRRLVALRRLRQEVSTTWLLGMGGAAALVAGLVHGLVDNAFFLPDLAALTWVAAALLAEVCSAPRRPMDGA